MDAPTSACPNCGTPRGPYDRFCTGCAADLGAPGSPIGVVGTLGVMNVAGPSSGQARAPGQGRATTAPAFQRVASGWVAPGARSPSVARSPSYAAASTGPLRQVGTPSATTGATGGAIRLWRTLGIVNRLLAVGWLGILVLAAASYLRSRPDPSEVIPFFLVLLVFAIPSWLLWRSAPRLLSGEPAWLRTIVLLEVFLVIVFSLGLALVPIIAIFVLAGDGT
jgi:hypothetical protein